MKKWTQDYKEFLEECIVNDDCKDEKKKKGQFIKEYREHHTDTKVILLVSLVLKLPMGSHSLSP